MSTTKPNEVAPWIQQVLKDMRDEEDACDSMPAKFTRETGMIWPLMDPGPDPDLDASSTPISSEVPAKKRG